MTMTPTARLFQSIETRHSIRMQWLKQIGVAAAATLVVLLVMIYAMAPAHARQISKGIITCDNRFGCSDRIVAKAAVEKRIRQTSHGRERIRVATIDASGNRPTVIGGRPAGCPYAYCGCGLRKFLGLNDTRLNLAWNWAKLFPRTHAHAGAAAVRHHHVMLLVAHVSGSIWTVRDYNGGRHLSYIHERDVSGYVFVRPGASRFASTTSEFL